MIKPHSLNRSQICDNVLIPSGILHLFQNYHWQVEKEGRNFQKKVKVDFTRELQKIHASHTHDENIISKFYLKATPDNMFI